jgi:hypothetical protein
MGNKIDESWMLNLVIIYGYTSSTPNYEVEGSWEGTSHNLLRLKKLVCFGIDGGGGWGVIIK